MKAGFQVFVLNPRRIMAFRDAECLIAKTDRLDAALIGRFAHKMSQDFRPLPDAELLNLKALSTRRRQLTEHSSTDGGNKKPVCRSIVRELLIASGPHHGRINQPGDFYRNWRRGAG
jgi:transposase